MRRDIILLIIALVALCIGCKKNIADPGVTPQTCDGIDSRFSAKVFPIIQASCASSAGCHGNGSTNGPGPLTSFALIRNASAAIKTAVVSGQMPLGGSLTTQEKNAIICWVNSGTPDN
jgi:hypothetical protein